MAELPLLRSCLFVPATRSDFVDKAKVIGPDAVFLDLEDSIPFGADKQRARRALPSLVARLDDIPVYVRVNDWESGLLGDDIIAAISARPTGLVLPKIECGEQIADVEKLIQGIDSNLRIPLIVLIETAAALLRLNDIAGASSWIVGLALGSEDLFADLQISPPNLASALAGPRAAVVTAARAHKQTPIDTVFTNFSNHVELLASLEAARNLGMDGMLALHPSQVAAANAVFSPTKNEIAWALRVQESVRGLTLDGKGVGVLNGEFLGPPIKRRAEQILLRARRCGVLDD